MRNTTRMIRRAELASASRQRGATLIVALLILVLVMMLGVTAISTSDTQFRLAGNLQFEDGAMNNAEAAIAEGESWLSTGTNYRNAAFDGAGPEVATDPRPFNAESGTPHIIPMTTVASIRAARATSVFNPDEWNDYNSVAVPMKDGSGNTNSRQRYFIELMSKNNRLQGSSQVVGGRPSATCNQVNTYLVTGRGESARGAVKYVQSFYSVLSCSE